MVDSDQPSANLTTGERAQLESFVHDSRVEIMALLDGLTEEQARRRLVSSQTTFVGAGQACDFRGAGLV